MDIVATYLRELRDIHASGSAVRETSYYGPLASLLNSVGKSLKPRVRCVINLQNRGAGIPDGGLFSADQLQRGDGAVQPGQLPSRGVLEVKGTGDDVIRIARGEQVTRYLGTYGQVLVTNYRDFLLVGRDEAGRPQERERFTLATTEAAFWTAAREPDTLAEAQGERLVEYLKRVMLSNAPLTRPQDVAWFLASYARDARARIERADLPALLVLRRDLEQALGINFNEQRGDHFFRSTLIQTLFYGVFSAWVLWHHEHPERNDNFDWRLAQYYLHVPVLQALFSQISAPQRLRPLGLMEVLEWTGVALNRVNRDAFFARFDTGQAVQYFYEPFLEAFDPQLRKELGVWYTPPEVVRYMVARVDSALREELGVADGLADPSVYVLDPCTGTGAYVAEVLRQIAATLRSKGEDALLGQDVKQAALSRVFGFELLPAPFVVAHLQIGLLLQQLGASLADNERVGVYLTNALTGWEPPDLAKRAVQLQLAGLPELVQERDQAERVKRTAPILVILGNPPYNGFAGIAQGEEADLIEPYKVGLTTKWGVKKYNMDDPYIRFLRLAERQIAEVGQRGGIVCYISNASYLNDPSFVVLRQHLVESFDSLSFDDLHGDSRETGKLTPDGKPDPSVFSTEFNREGIRVGTAVCLLVRNQQRQGPLQVRIRDFWGASKRADLVSSLEAVASSPKYQLVTPVADNRYSFYPSSVAPDYPRWPLLPSLFPTSFPGVTTSRDNDLVDFDRNELHNRMKLYHDSKTPPEELRKTVPVLMEETNHFEAAKTRETLVRQGFQEKNIVRFYYRPFDVRWLYWEGQTRLLNRARPDYFPHVFPGNIWFSAGKHHRKLEFYQPQVTSLLADYHIVESNVNMFPLWLAADSLQASFLDEEGAKRPNLTDAALGYLRQLEGEPADLFHHTIAVLHSSIYCDENADGLRQDWPRIPLPADRKALLASAALGREVAALLNSEHQVPGATVGDIRAELRTVGVLSVVGGGQINPATGDLELTTSWGFAGRGGITMPGKGRVVKRPATEAEVNLALGVVPGGTTYDIYLNDRVYWRNVPPRAWEYTIGGYQVIKKWLSYRERDLLGRGLRPEEAREVRDIARRIAAILLLEPALDENYRAVTVAAFPWSAAGSDI